MNSDDKITPRDLFAAAALGALLAHQLRTGRVDSKQAVEDSWDMAEVMMMFRPSNALRKPEP